jgi:hypothetical protein
MKIIITESQYKNILESKEEKKSDLLYGMWMDGMSMDDIKEYTGLNTEQIIVYLKDKEIYIDCEFAETLLPTLYRTSLINKNFRSGDETLRLEWTFGAFITFNYEDPKYELRGYATPYWNKECVTPVDSNYFLDKETNEYEDDNDSFTMITDNTPSSFNTIQEFIDFLNNDYPKYLFRIIHKIIKKRMGFN